MGLGFAHRAAIRQGPGPVHCRGQTLGRALCQRCRRPAAAPDRRPAVPPADPDRAPGSVHPTVGDGDRRRARARGPRWHVVADRDRRRNGPARSRSRSRRAAGCRGPRDRSLPDAALALENAIHSPDVEVAQGICLEPGGPPRLGRPAVSNPPYVEEHEPWHRVRCSRIPCWPAGGIGVYERLFAQRRSPSAGGRCRRRDRCVAGVAHRRRGRGCRVRIGRGRDGSHRTRPDRHGAEAHIAWIPSPTPSPPFARAG